MDPAKRAAPAPYRTSPGTFASVSSANSLNHPVITGRSSQRGGTRSTQFPSPSWQYLYPPATTNARSIPRSENGTTLSEWYASINSSAP